MLTAEQQAKLRAFAAGQVQIGPGQVPPDQVVQIQAYPGCPQNNQVGPTQMSVPVDLSQANQDQCGLVTIYIDRTSTDATGSRLLVIGGCIGEGDSAIAQEFFEFPSTPLLVDEDLDNVIGGNSPNYNPTVFIPWLQCQVENKNMMFSTLLGEDTGSTGGAFTTFKNQKLLKSSLSMEGDWETCNPKLKGSFCDPCFSDNELHAKWDGFMPVSGANAIALVIPAGFNGNLQFCVFQYENARNMTMCAQA